jgi:hypothetical protein
VLGAGGEGITQLPGTQVRNAIQAHCCSFVIPGGPGVPTGSGAGGGGGSSANAAPEPTRPAAAAAAANAANTTRRRMRFMANSNPSRRWADRIADACSARTFFAREAAPGNYEPPPTRLPFCGQYA